MTASVDRDAVHIEEVKALSRGRFARLGAAVILLAIGGLVTVGTQDTWLDGYGIVAYGGRVVFTGANARAWRGSGRVSRSGCSSC